MTTTIDLADESTHAGATTPLVDADVVDQATAAYNTATNRNLMEADLNDPDDPYAASRAHHSALSAAAASAHHMGVHAGLQQVRTAFADTYSRITGQPCDDGVLQQVLDATALKFGNMFRRIQDAAYTRDYTGIGSPVTVLNELLTWVSATAAALGFPATATAEEIRTQMASEDITTSAADAARLHLLSEHGDVNALNVPDRVAALMHAAAHQRGAGHEPTDLSYDPMACEDIVADLPEEDRENVGKQLNAALSRAGNPGDGQ